MCSTGTHSNMAEMADAVEQNTTATDIHLAGEELEEQEVKAKNTSWSHEEVQALLVKAINYRAPLDDIKTVLKCGAKINVPIKNGLHALHYAAYMGYKACIQLLLDSGANVNATDDIGYTPLHLCARGGNFKSIETLIDNGAIINFNEPGTIIHNTDEKNKLGYTTTEPLNLAIQNCHTECVRLLLERGARADNHYFMGPEICLAPLDNVECLEVLLQHGSDPNVYNRCGLTPLMKASKDHYIDAVRLLLKHGADVNAQCPPLYEQKSALHFAINSGNIVIINLLLGKKAKLGKSSEYKYSALHTAIVKGRADICRLLLQHGADVHERTEEEATPLMLACGIPGVGDREEIVRMLVDCGADVNAHAPGFRYFDPYLSPLTEYFKNIGNDEGFNIVQYLIINGATIHYCSGEFGGLNRFKDPFGILPYAHCMRNAPDLFTLTMTAARRYNPLAIYACDTLPDDMKDDLLYMSIKPRKLKHTVRCAVRQFLLPGLPEKVKQLPLPKLLQSYLLFK